MTASPMSQLSHQEDCIKFEFNSETLIWVRHSFHNITFWVLTHYYLPLTHKVGLTGFIHHIPPNLTGALWCRIGSKVLCHMNNNPDKSTWIKKSSNFILYCQKKGRGKTLFRAVVSNLFRLQARMPQHGSEAGSWVGTRNQMPLHSTAAQAELLWSLLPTEAWGESPPHCQNPTFTSQIKWPHGL